MVLESSHTPFELCAEKVTEIVLASVCLHNFLQIASDQEYMPVGCVDTEDARTHQVVEGDWRRNIHLDAMQPIEHQGSNNYSTDAKQVRDSFKVYFNTVGAVEWQDNMI